LKAVVFHGVGDIRLESVKSPRLEAPDDAVVRITSSAICGTDLHFVRGTVPGMRPGTILGHEGVGVVEEVGEAVRSFSVGDRVVIPSTICCGTCVYCRAGYYAQCDCINPNGKTAGTAFYGGPESSGPFQGLQAEFARVPKAAANLVKLPEDVSDAQAILLSDIFPTGYFAAELAEIRPGDTVAIFGCGPVGMFTIASAQLLDAGRIFAVDHVASRLKQARQLGAETVDFDAEDPVEVLRDLTGGSGPDRVIDAVGVDAVRAHRGPAAEKSDEHKQEFERELDEIVPQEPKKKAQAQRGRWQPGDGPSQVLRWAVEAIAKAGTLSIVGVYPEEERTFPLGAAMNKNLTINMGNCNHRRYLPRLLRLVRSGQVDPTRVLTQQADLASAIDAYASFDQRRAGWMKVQLTSH
jgi:threonine dehydrogenase-like Zn-dependent dehydrogenase